MKLLRLTFNLFELSRLAILAFVLLAATAAIFGLPLVVEGASMEPNFQTGSLVLVERISYINDRPIKRGDVVEAKFPANPKKTRLIKRVIGLPGETVESDSGRITINGQPLEETDYRPRLGPPPYSEIKTERLGPGEYFLAGDNRPNSSDSRLWGSVKRTDILGRVSFILWPLSQASYISRY
ncbi:MAG: signal peptidase I [Patescibacteria group bacterium]